MTVIALFARQVFFCSFLSIAILAADAVGYSLMMREDEQERWPCCGSTAPR
jgi:hypothetical protein